jgi:hypothetical protein
MAISFDMPGRSAKRLSDVTGEIDPNDRAIVAAGWVNHDGPSHHRHVDTRRTGGRYGWTIKDHSVSPHLPCASGRAWTRAGAWRQLERAYDELLRSNATERSGIRDRRDDGLVP